MLFIPSKTAVFKPLLLDWPRKHGAGAHVTHRKICLENLGGDSRSLAVKPHRNTLGIYSLL